MRTFARYYMIKSTENNDVLAMYGTCAQGLSRYAKPKLYSNKEQAQKSLKKLHEGSRPFAKVVRVELVMDDEDFILD